MEEEKKETEQVTSKKSNTIFMGILLICFIVVASGAYLSRHSLKGMVMGSTTQTPVKVAVKLSPTTAPAEKVFTIDGGEFYFKPNMITVKKGDKVKIIFHNSGGFHDLVIDQFNAKTDRIGSGETATIEFVADKTGTFTYYCSVGRHKQLGMLGTLIVE